MHCELECETERIEEMIRHALWSSGGKGVVVGVSGGVDSAVATALCTGALGKERVKGLLLPASVSKAEDIRDAEKFCAHLDIEYTLITIQPILDTYRKIPGFVKDLVLEGNLLARIRMALLYYHANRENRLVCGTSNRSEYLLGYCTKYGDNAADLQPILHLFKTEVYELASHLGIPSAILSKSPSAGFWADQTDEGELGLRYTEIDQALQRLERTGWAASTVVEEQVLRLVEKSRHKRSPPLSLLPSS